MNILTRSIGLLARLIAGWHRLLSRFHGWRMQVHSDKEDGHKAQADSLAQAASTLAPPKQKVIEAQPEPAQISPPSPARERQALAAVAVQNFHPARREEDS